jgi:uroporphyrinogen-III synthase
MLNKKVLYTGLDPTYCQAQGDIIHVPLIQIVPRSPFEPQIKTALANFSAYTHVLITSKSTVALLANYLPLFGQNMAQWALKTTIAVGEVTANHLRQIGIFPKIIAKEETAEGMTHELAQLDLKNSFCFWPHSAQARSVLSDFLAQQPNLTFTTCSLYETQTRLPETLPDLHEFEEIIFTSPSTVRAFVEIFGKIPLAIRLTAIGPITQSYLKKFL